MTDLDPISFAQRKWLVWIVRLPVEFIPQHRAGMNHGSTTYLPFLRLGKKALPLQKPEQQEASLFSAWENFSRRERGRVSVFRITPLPWFRVSRSFYQETHVSFHNWIQFQLDWVMGQNWIGSWADPIIPTSPTRTWRNRFSSFIYFLDETHFHQVSTILTKHILINYPLVSIYTNK